MKTEDFNYHLPKNLIAQEPVYPKDRSKLMLIEKDSDKISHSRFSDLVNILEDNAIIVTNKTKVIQAKFFGKRETGGLVEFLAIESISVTEWLCYAKPTRRLTEGESVKLIDINNNSSHEDNITIVKKNNDGSIIVKTSIPMRNLQKKYGIFALPPYIKKKIKQESDYQTLFAESDGSIAAPTAGLHFTKELIQNLISKGIKFESIDLTVGPGTFQPVKTEKIENHKMHSERFEISSDTAQRLNKYKNEQRPIYVVGTTTCRAIESSSTDKGLIEPCKKSTSIFISPGYKFKFVENLITNFHLPKSTLLMLISALYDRERILDAYNIAIDKKYRFYSLGDAMLIRK